MKFTGTGNVRAFQYLSTIISKTVTREDICKHANIKMANCKSIVTELVKEGKLTVTKKEKVWKVERSIIDALDGKNISPREDVTKKDEENFYRIRCKAKLPIVFILSNMTMQESFAFPFTDLSKVKTAIEHFRSECTRKNRMHIPKFYIDKEKPTIYRCWRVPT